MDIQKTPISNSRRWYDKKRFILPLLLFVFPVGLYFLWKGNAFSKEGKIGLSIALVLFFFFYVASLVLPKGQSNQVVDNNLPDRVDMVAEEITTNGDGTVQFDLNGNEVGRTSSNKPNGIKITKKELLQNELEKYFTLEKLEEENSYGAMAGNVVMKIEGVDGNYSLIQLNLFVVPDDQNVGPAVTTAMFKNLLGNSKGEKEANKLFVAFANQEEIKMKEYDTFILNVDAKKTEDGKAFVILDFLPKTNIANNEEVKSDKKEMTDLERARLIQENPKTKWALNLVQGEKWDFNKITNKLGNDYEVIQPTKLNPNIVKGYYFKDANVTLFTNTLKNTFYFSRIGRESE